ncbi:MAG: aldehyde dehydrogenase family protein, partial [Dermabacteraceae bacterium]
MAGYTTTNPTTGRTDKEFTTLDSAEVERVLDRSHAAFAEWRATTAEERASILERVADAYDDRSRELGELIAAEMGKPLQQSIGEAELAASIYRWYATHGPDLLQPE